MAEKMRHYVGGPLDGITQIVADQSHPFVIDVSTDTDGFYVVEYQVTGRQAGGLTLTADDIVARWHQRQSATDFMIGDTVIVKASGERGTLLAPLTTHFEGGDTESGWLLRLGNTTMFMVPSEVRVATPQERNGT